MNSEQIRKDVTDRIVKLLESGDVGKWVRPWVQYGSPRNLGTGRKYSGLLNIMLLQQVAMDSGYQYPLWATYHQLQSLGANVLKGQRGCRVVFWKEYNRNIETAVEENPILEGEGNVPDGKRKHFFLQYFSVFNVQQTTLDVEKFSARLGIELRKHTPVESLEAFVQAQGIPIVQGGDIACYIPSQDRIAIPSISQFDSVEAYYQCLLHENAHASGHTTRLNRDLSGKFGSEIYAREEITAELASLYLCAELGIEGKLQHAEYIKPWLEVLKADTREIFKIAGNAKKAVDYLQSKANLLEKNEQIDIAS